MRQKPQFSAVLTQRSIQTIKKLNEDSEEVLFEGQSAGEVELPLVDELGSPAIIEDEFFKELQELGVEGIAPSW